MQLIMETLSPVQVGSGNELMQDLDYIQHNGMPLVVDQNRCFDALAAQGNVTAASTAKTLTDALQKLNEPYGYRLPSLHGKTCKPQQIREQMKDARWRPLVPGSSLKGAIRTALLAEYLRSTESQSQRNRLVPRNKDKPKEAVKALSENYFSPDAPRGKSPNHDVMRAWKIGDTLFAQADLCLADVRFLNLGLIGHQTVLKWKNMAGRNSVESWQQASGVYVEALCPGAVAGLQIHVDDFLFHDHLASQQLCWKPFPDSFSSLRVVMNNHAEYRLCRERDFYRQYNCQEALETCDEIRQKMDQEKDAIYLQMGWGSGWRGMTGDWQHQAGVEKDMRRLYNLGKNKVDEFPKTRRLAVFNGAPSLPFGWIRLWQAADRPALREQADHEKNQQMAKIVDRASAIQSLHVAQQEKMQEQELQRIHLQEEEAEKARLKAEEEVRIAAMTPFEQELEAIIAKDISLAIGELTKGLREELWQENEARMAALRLKALLQKTGTWLPEFAGTNKNKMKIHDRSKLVMRFL